MLGAYEFADSRLPLSFKTLAKLSKHLDARDKFTKVRTIAFSMFIFIIFIVQVLQYGSRALKYFYKEYLPDSLMADKFLFHFFKGNETFFFFPQNYVFRCHSIYDSTRKARKAFRILKFVNECYEIGQLLSTWNDEVREIKD